MRVKISISNRIFMFNIYKKQQNRQWLIEYIILDYFKNPGNFMLYSSGDFVEVLEISLHPYIEALCKQFYILHNFTASFEDVIGALINHRFVNYKRRYCLYQQKTINIFYDQKYKYIIEKYDMPRLVRWAAAINKKSSKIITEPILTTTRIKEGWNFESIVWEDSKKLNWILSKLHLLKNPINVGYLYGSIANSRFRAFHNKR